MILINDTLVFGKLTCFVLIIPFTDSTLCHHQYVGFLTSLSFTQVKVASRGKDYNLSKYR